MYYIQETISHDLGKHRVLKNVAVSENIDSIKQAYIDLVILGTPISKLKLVQELVTDVAIDITIDVTITNSIATLKGEDKNESK